MKILMNELNLYNKGKIEKLTITRYGFEKLLIPLIKILSANLK